MAHKFIIYDHFGHFVLLVFFLNIYIFWTLLLNLSKLFDLQLCFSSLWLGALWSKYFYAAPPSFWIFFWVDFIITPEKHNFWHLDPAVWVNTHCWTGTLRWKRENWHSSRWVREFWKVSQGWHARLFRIKHEDLNAKLISLCSCTADC